MHLLCCRRRLGKVTHISGEVVEHEGSRMYDIKRTGRGPMNIDRGYFMQYKLSKPLDWPNIAVAPSRNNRNLGKVNAPPRWLNLVLAAEAEGLLDMWMYSVHFQQLLARLKITSKDGLEVVWRERNELGRARILSEKSGIPRFVGEASGRTMTVQDSILTVESFATKAQAQSFFLQLQFSLGAHGGVLEEYPIKCFGGKSTVNFRFGRVRISDYNSFRNFLDSHNREQSGPNKRLPSVTLYTDPSPWAPVITTGDYTAIIGRPTSKYTQTGKLPPSNYEVEQLQLKLDELKRMLAQQAAARRKV